jgi:hypothetical protein
MSDAISLQPATAALTHDPFGRTMTEQQKIRLREQTTPPLEESPKDEPVGDRRLPVAEVPEQGPGRIIDRYA